MEKRGKPTKKQQMKNMARENLFCEAMNDELVFVGGFQFVFRDFGD